MFSIDMLSGNLMLLLAILVFVAVLSNKLGAKVGVPSILIFLVVGMIAGQDGIGLKFENYHAAEFFSHLAIAVILITGGLHTNLEESRPVIKQGSLLSTIGVIIMVAITGLFLYFFAGERDILGAPLSLFSCILVAAILSSTDSTAVFSILRSRRLHLRENLDPLIELESGSNDPMAFILTIVFTKILTVKADVVAAASPAIVALATFGLVLYQVVSGYFMGRWMGKLGAKVLEKVGLDSATMVSILILAWSFLSDGITSLIGGSGLLALYVSAITLGNSGKIKEKREVLKFFDGISWLGQLLMVLILGLLTRPSHMGAVAVPAIILGLFMMFVARPASVFLTLLPFRKLPAKAKLLVSWMGVKGAGPILFALYAVLNNVERGTEIFNVVLIIILMSLILQGMTLVPFAKLLDLCVEDDPVVKSFGLELPEEMGMLTDHVVKADDIPEGGVTLRDMRLPHGIRVVMVKREEKFLVPHGSMKLQEGDHLIIVMGDTDED